ncbi:MAG TPA: 4a-hydroxytetrahydrobiopterin dehydratase [Kofleriaceae bacterium]|nr:4a-hydroxytetrahydrobiopterin dehydratase [Kofleriaceae bacterium]
MTTELADLATQRGTELLAAPVVRAAVAVLGEGWQVVHASLMFTARPATMIDSAAIVAQAATIAEQLNHHPDIEVGYQWLRISISTHDSGGITALDFAFAAQLQPWRRAGATA